MSRDVLERSTEQTGTEGRGREKRRDENGVTRSLYGPYEDESENRRRGMVRVGGLPEYWVREWRKFRNKTIGEESLQKGAGKI